MKTVPLQAFTQRLNRFQPSPIALRELTGRMRNVRTYTVLTVYLAIVSALAVLLYLVSFLSGSRTVGSSGVVGTVVFYFLVGMQVLLVSFIAPAFTVSAISAERERNTLDTLRATLLSSHQIVWAKLVSALGFTLLLIFATLPLFSLAFLLGGVEPLEMLIALVVLLCSALMFSLLGLYISARSHTSLGATVITYAVTLGIVVGVPLASLIGSSTLSLALSPTAAASSVLANIFETLLSVAISCSPISAIVASQRYFAATGSVLTFNPAFVSAGLSLTLPSPYLILAVVYLIASAALYLGTVRRLTRIGRE
jgi:ABC-type transport system involved in multi-copper enzyme maturation permease subunit